MMQLNRIALAALVCVALYPPRASAQAQDEAFKKGLKAKDDKNWVEAAKQMRLAIQLDPTESLRKVKVGGVLVFGAKEIEYLPHFFLGEALLNQNDCVGAVSEWSTSLDQHLVQTKVEYRQVIERGVRDCATKGVLSPPEFNAQSKVSLQAYNDANAMATHVIDIGKTHNDQWSPLASQYEQARRDLENAFTRLNAAGKSRAASDFAESKAASERAVLKLKALEDALNAAIESVATLQQRVREVNDAITGADALDRSIDGLKASLTDAMVAARKSGRDQLGQARDKLAAGQKTQNVATVNEANKFVQSATATYNQVVDQINKARRSEQEQRLGVAMLSADEAFASVSTLMTTLDARAAQKPDKITPDITSQREAVRKQLEALRQRYERARKAEDVGGIETVTKQTSAAQAVLSQIIQAFGPLSLRDRGVDAGLEDGARLFLTGDYQKALEALDPSTGVDAAPSPSLQVQAHLFRAASLFALYVRSGESRQELRTQALAEIERCKQIDATFQPSTQVFSPRFVLLYKTGGAAASRTANATQ
jgi:tetratricopeptide (TPR) repeat protein